MSEPRPTVSRRYVLKIGSSATLLPLGFILGFPGPIQHAYADAHAFEFKALDHGQAMLLLSARRHRHWEAMEGFLRGYIIFWTHLSLRLARV